MPTKKTDIQTDVTNRIIEALEGNLLPWRRGWKASPNGGNICTSLSSGAEYRGINQLLLQLASWRSEYESKWWGTYRQINATGGQVKRKERGVRIVLFKPIKRTRLDAHGKERDDSFCIKKYFVVFNAEQCSGMDSFLVTDVPDNGNVFERHEQAEKLIKASGCKFNLGSRAFYSPKTDEITLPRRESFESAEEFYETAFHELCHYAESRTGFDRKKHENSYAFAELVAEVGSCLLMSRLQLETRSTFENSAAYLKNWLSALRHDTKFIFRAASQAQKATDFIWSKVESKEETSVAA